MEGWDITREQYFKELLRVSKNRIVWERNYFEYYLGLELTFINGY